MGRLANGSHGFDMPTYQGALAPRYRLCDSNRSQGIKASRCLGRVAALVPMGIGIDIDGQMGGLMPIRRYAETSRDRFALVSSEVDAHSAWIRFRWIPIRLGFEGSRCPFGWVSISLGFDSAGFRGSWEPRSLGFEISTHQDRLVRPIDDSVETSCADTTWRGTESGKGPV